MGRKILDKVQNGSKKTGTKKLDTKKVKALKKKAYELSTLCDVQVALVLYGSDGEPPIVWPEDPGRLNGVLDRYLNTTLEERQKRALTLATLPNKSQNHQVLDELDGSKQVDKALPKSEFQWNGRIDSLSSEQLMGLANHLDSKIQLVNNKIDGVKKMGQSYMQLIPSIQHQYQGQGQSQSRDEVYGNYQGYNIEEQSRNTEMMTSMRMVNHGEFYNFNHENVNMGNYNFSNYNNGVTIWDVKPLTWYDPQQAQQFSGHTF